MALIKDNNMVNLLKEFPDYSIYSLTQDEICLFAVSNVANNKLSLYLDVNNKVNYDLLLEGKMSKEDVVDKIGEDYKIIKNSNPNSIYVLPNFDTSKLEQALNNGVSGDKQAIFNVLAGIGADTKKIQSILAGAGVSIDTTINVVGKTEIDKKFANFLESQRMGVLRDFKEMQVKNESVSDVKAPISTNPFATPSVASNDVANSNNEVFNDNSDKNQEFVVNPETIIPQDQIPVEPTPVQNVPLNDDLSETTALQLEGLQQGDSELQNDQGMVKTRKKNGYVNILIFMVVLVGVTILSIQLGKFLYSVYG